MNGVLKFSIQIPHFEPIAQTRGNSNFSLVNNRKQLFSENKTSLGDFQLSINDNVRDKQW